MSGGTWRAACVRWQSWAAGLLTDLGLQIEGGELGDHTARRVIAEYIASQRHALRVLAINEGQLRTQIADLELELRGLRHARMRSCDEG